MQIRWDDIDRYEWERRIAAGAPGGAAALQQSWAYGEASRSIGGEAVRAAVDFSGRPAALAQFTLRRIGFGRHCFATWALCQRGPIWLNAPGETPLSETEKAEIYRALRASAPIGRRRAVFFAPEEERPGESLAEAGLRRVMTGYGTALLDLTQDLDALRRAMRGKWRNRLAAAERSDLRLAASRPKPGRLDWLLRKDLEQQRAQGYKALPPGFVDAYQRAGDAVGEPGGERRSLRLFRADLGGACVAAMLFLVHGRAATYHIGWADEEGKKRSAHNALLWKAMRELKAGGARALDLGGVDTERGAGIARFKLGSGARPVTLCGTYF